MRSQSTARREAKKTTHSKCLEPVQSIGRSSMQASKINSSREQGVLIDREMRSEQEELESHSRLTRRVSVEHQFCEDRSPLHKLNKSNAELPDKIRGNHSSRSNACVAVQCLTTEAVGIQEDSSLPSSSEREEEWSAPLSI